MRTRPGHLAATAVLTAVSMAAVVSPATASKSATPTQARTITRAIRTSSVAGIDKVAANRCVVSRVKISTVSGSWATASLVARKPFRNTFQSAYVVAVKPAGTSSWVVVDLGSAEVGCGIAPDPVLSDLLGLKTGEAPCPPGEGIS